MTDDRAQLQTEAPVCGQESLTGHLRSHRAITQDEVRQDREHRFASRTLETPDGDPTQADAHIMGVARQQPSSQHPILWWGVNSTLFGKHPLDLHPKPHGA